MNHTETICGADCSACRNKDSCPGCAATCGRPFGGDCIAAEYIKIGGTEKYAEFKKCLLSELNALLSANGLPEAAALYELAGSFVNLAYPLPSGESMKLLDDKKIYLGTQIEIPDEPFCFGAVVGMDFILVSRYGENGTDPELVLYKKR